MGVHATRALRVLVALHDHHRASDVDAEALALDVWELAVAAACSPRETYRVLAWLRRAGAITRLDNGRYMRGPHAARVVRRLSAG